MSRGRRIAVGTLALAAAVLAVPGCGDGERATPGPVRRVMIVTLPDVGWRDVDAGFMPNLRQLTGDAGIGNLATRVGRQAADTAGAYLTMGAGTRAVGPPEEEGLAVAPGEQVGDVESSDLIARRLGEVPDGIAYVAAGPAADRNDDTVYGAEVGLLGDGLDAAGIDRGVVANGDRTTELGGTEPAGLTLEPHREAATLLMGSDGLVPGGRVDAGLLLADAASPFGVRLDTEAVVAAAAEAWTAGSRSVVVVEASDLHRAVAYAGLSTPLKSRALRDRALSEADDLLGRLLDLTDPETDAVLVLGVPTAPGRPDLGVAALRAPGAGAGYLRSATTGRDGYVQLADVGPTVLDLLGEDHERQVEGRPMAVVTSEGRRVATLARDAREAGFRDRMVPGVTIAFVAVLALLLAATLRSRHSAVLRPIAYTVLGAAAATFVAGAAWASPAAALPYLAYVLAAGGLIGAAATVADRRWEGSGPVVALGAIVAVVAVDVAQGATLQINTVFGYSVAVAGRFAGLGNLAFAILSAAAVLLAAVLADRYGDRGRWTGVAILAAVVFIDGFPLLGADVGGSLAMVPAFGITALVLAGRPVRWHHLGALVLLAVAVTLTFAFVDLARPESSQTHLARFARLVLDGRWEVMTDSLGRRFEASFGSVESLGAGLLVTAAAAAALYIALVDRDRLPTAADRERWPRPVVAAVAGLAVLALLGWTANDSSFAVPATMLIVVVPVLVDRLVRAS